MINEVFALDVIVSTGEGKPREVFFFFDNKKLQKNYIINNN